MSDATDSYRPLVADHFHSRLRVSATGQVMTDTLNTRNVMSDLRVALPLPTCPIST
jgi:hypothetical protein